MDNHAQDFARQIIARLDAIKGIIVNTISEPDQKYRGAEHDQRSTANQTHQGNAKPELRESEPRIARQPDSSGKNNERFKWIAEWKPVIELATLLFIAGYTFIAIFMWCSTRESNNINREALTSVQRAFVSFKSLTGDRIVYQDRAPRLEFSAVLENSGVTPAVGVIEAFNFDELESEPDGDIFIGPHHPQSLEPTTIGPKGIHEIGPRAFVDFIQQQLPLAQGHRHYAWGWTRYKDIFPSSKVHVTEFCYALVTAFNAPAEGGGIKTNWSGCDRHNCTDEYCKDYAEILKAK